ncbi:MAG: cofactor-independent phosphoglycerate mutase [Candidatus Altiarchaeota archaeon]|nr:cofactor-independent phosphoglycerate mutase [Candidatus Altiarchaeota archaeon]
MKYVILVGDGMSDYPLEELGGKTPLQVARKPNMDWLAKNGRCGLLKTIPDGMPAGSDIANMSILGYDPRKYSPGGRGPIEAAAMGIEVRPNDLAIRCNIITGRGGRIEDYSGGKISNEEAKILIGEANRNFGKEGVEFFPGISYRNLLVLRDCNLKPGDLIFEAPHDHMGEPFEGLLVKGTARGRPIADMLNEFILRSGDILDNNAVNVKRVEEGKAPANRLWFWGAGKPVTMPTLKERFGLSGVVVSGVDLVKGLGALAGLEIADVPGATGYLDTDYEGKADAALGALKEKDLAFIHVEAPDEAGHEALIEEKIKAIENIDKRLLDRIIKGLREEEHKIALLPDHPTPIKIRTHASDPVPFVIFSSGDGKDNVEKFDEDSVKNGAYGLKEGPELINLLINHGPH